jgi:hypothetical protein
MYIWGGDPNYELSGSDNPYDYGFTGVPGGMYVLPGEGVGERAETGLTTPEDTGLPAIDPITGRPTVTSGGTNFLDALAGLFTGATGGKLGQMAAFGGVAALLNKMMGQQSQQPVGYQGGIPKYTFERTQTPMAQQRPEGYRPGQGGISYFTPGRFTPAGYTPKTAEEFLVRPAAPAPAQESGGGGVVPLPGSDMIQDGNTTVITNASGGYMPGGIAMLAKGRYLRGNGDGVSDSIPARFAGSGQEARLADGEFVIPARVVSELGNGSSDAGARKLYAMLDRVEARAKKAKRGKPSGADRELNKLA